MGEPARALPSSRPAVDARHVLALDALARMIVRDLVRAGVLPSREAPKSE